MPQAFKALFILLLLNAQFVSAESIKITLEVNGLSSRGGQIAYAVFDSADFFPDDERGIILADFQPLEAGQRQAKIELTLPKAGNYAFAIYQDENLNEKLDKNRLGMPIEKFGFSNDPSIFRGVPAFHRCQVPLRQSGDKLKINLKSIL